MMLFILVPGLPLALACFLAIVPPARETVVRMAPFATLPGLLVALWAPSDASAPWLLLGSRFGVDAPAQAFLLVTSLAWALAAWFATTYMAGAEHRHRFFTYFLLAMGGNLGVLVAQDVATFYAAFAIMTFSAYGLVIHEATNVARRAARVYILLAIAGEMALIVGLIFAAWLADSLQVAEIAAALATADHRHVAIALLAVAFGIKVGMVPLHVWLPLAHPVAPTPASATLSGTMIKAGVFGWLRFLPLGVAEVSSWGWIYVWLGFAAAFFGVVVGITQTNPKANLAYSSVSQMGLVAIILGLAFLEPDVWPVAVAAVAIFVVHHGFAKTALFLATGVAPGISGRRGRAVLLGGAIIAGLSLAAAPLTSGMIAKIAITEVAAPMPVPGAWFGWLLSLTSVGTTLLMVRFVFLLRETIGTGEPGEAGRWLWAPWILAIGFVVMAAWFLQLLYGFDLHLSSVIKPAKLWAAAWPVVAALALTAGWLRLAPRWWTRWQVPPGDIVGLAEHAGATTERVARRGLLGATRRVPHWSRLPGMERRGITLGQMVHVESCLSSWANLGYAIVVLVALVALLLARG